MNIGVLAKHNKLPFYIECWGNAEEKRPVAGYIYLRDTNQSVWHYQTNKKKRRSCICLHWLYSSHDVSVTLQLAMTVEILDYSLYSDWSEWQFNSLYTIHYVYQIITKKRFDCIRPIRIQYIYVRQQTRNATLTEKKLH